MNAEKIVLISAILVALVAAFVNFQYMDVILVILGVILGFIGVPEEKRNEFLVMAIALFMVTNALDPIPAVGSYLTSILKNISIFVSAEAAIVIIKMIAQKISSAIIKYIYEK